jgi:WD40 repeat protein
MAVLKGKTLVALVLVLILMLLTAFWSHAVRSPRPTLLSEIDLKVRAGQMTLDGSGGMLVLVSDRVMLLSADRFQKICDLTDGTKHTECIAFSAVNSLLAAEEDGAVITWDLKTRSRKAVLDGGDVVTHLAFAPDGTKLAASQAGKPNLITVMGPLNEQDINSF